MRFFVNEAQPAKTELTTQGTKALIALSGTGASFWLQHASLFISILVGITTAAYVVVQLAFLVRRWYLLEKNAKLPTWE